MQRIYPGLVVALLLTACNVANISLAVVKPIVSPSPQPAILSLTPLFIPSATSTITILPIPPTFSETSSFAPTEIPPKSSNLLLDILGCDTSLDIFHQMGEVTNAYPIIRNSTEINLSNVCATLSSSDEARVHPNKTPV